MWFNHLIAAHASSEVAMSAQWYRRTSHINRQTNSTCSRNASKEEKTVFIYKTENRYSIYKVMALILEEQEINSVRNAYLLSLCESVISNEKLKRTSLWGRFAEGNFTITIKMEREKSFSLSLSLSLSSFCFRCYFFVEFDRRNKNKHSFCVALSVLIFEESNCASKMGETADDKNSSLF